MHALEAGIEAAERAGVPGGHRTGVFAGLDGLHPRWDELEPALDAQRDDAAGSWERGLSRLHPFFVLRHLSNGPQALLAARLGATGEGNCCSGTIAGVQALLSAKRALECGAIDHAVVVAFGGERAAAVVLQRTGLASLEAATGIDPISTAEPSAAAIESIVRKVSRGAPVRDVRSEGAPTALLQAIECIQVLAPGAAAVAASWGAPGLVAAVRVEAA